MMGQVPDLGKRDWLCFKFNLNTNILYENPIYEKRSIKAEKYIRNFKSFTSISKETFENVIRVCFLSYYATYKVRKFES